MASASSVPAEVLAFLRERHAGDMHVALWVRAAVIAAEPDLT